MDEDKYKAIWLSYSAIKDFLNCPRAYYFRYVYRNPKTGKKISIAKPALSLGSVVHSVLDQISVLPTKSRFDVSLTDRFEKEWTSVTGKRGGFSEMQEETLLKARGCSMIERIEKNPGILALPAVKIKEDIPYYLFSKEENLILCGKIDWLSYDEKNNSVHIVDFKTGKVRESDGSLQLPIYILLTTNCQKRPVSGASYWYLESEDEPIPVQLPNVADSERTIMDVGMRIKLARQLNHFKCISDEKQGCRYCASLGAIVNGKGEFVGSSAWGDEVYYLSPHELSLSTGSPRYHSLDFPDDEE